MKSLAVVLHFLICAAFAFSQDANVTLKASKAEVAVGEQFSIVLSANVNGNGDVKLPNGFQVVSRMSGSSSRFINGQQSFEVTRTFVVVASSKGEFTIPAATWSYGSNKTAKSNSLKIKVVEGSRTPPQKQQQQQYYDPFGSLFGQRQQQQQNSGGEKHFGMLISSKREVYVGEPIVLSGKVYFDGHIVDVANYEPHKMDMRSHKTDLRNTNQNLTVEREEYGGKMYQSIFLFEELIVPQQAGEYTIEPFSINIGFQRGFFNSGYKPVKSNATTLVVLPLPKNAPSGFDGAVGSYKLNVEYDLPKEPKTGDVIGIRLKLEGQGNMHLLNPIALNLPAGILLYGDPKTESKVKTSRSGGGGSVEYEFIMQIEEPGAYDFKPFEFAYFNPETKKYVQETVPNLKFDAKGESVSFEKQEELAQQEEEEKIASTVWRSLFLSVIGLTFLFVLIYFLRKNSELFRFKRRKPKVDAHKVAIKSLDAVVLDQQTLDQVEKIILQFFKDFTQNEQLLISEQWFEMEGQQFGIATATLEQWRAHFATIQAMKYASFGQMSNEELVKKTRDLVRETK